VEEADLARLHGLLLASDWVEQDTGAATMPRPGVVGQCYRAPPSGRRALQQVANGDETDPQAA
jgi:hypothetical protein